MKITRVELDNIKKSNDLSSDIEVYEWILSTYTESVFFDNIEIMELINEAKEKLALEKQKIIDKFCIRMNNDNCGFQNIHYKCINKLHPDYAPWKTPLCTFEKCPLKGKYLSLIDEEKGIIVKAHNVNAENLCVKFDKLLGLQIETCNCDRCENKFTKDELIIFNNRILCFVCKEQVGHR